MSKLIIERTIPATADRVWNAWADFGGIWRFHPYVEASPLLSDQTEGVGTERQCAFYDGNTVKERIVAWDDGRRMVVDIVEGSMPIAMARAEILLDPIDDHTTHIRFAMDYTPKWGVLGRVMDAMMMRKQFTTILDDVLASLEVHLDTGKAVGQHGELFDVVAAK